MDRIVENRYTRATKVWLSEEKMKTSDNVVGNHPQLKEKYRRTAHQPCNLKVRKTHSFFKLFLFDNFNENGSRLVIKTI